MLRVILVVFEQDIFSLEVEVKDHMGVQEFESFGYTATYEKEGELMVHGVRRVNSPEERQYLVNSQVMNPDFKQA